MNMSKRVIPYSLIASLCAGLGLFATNAIADTAYKYEMSDKGCAGDPKSGGGGQCLLNYSNNSKYDIKAEVIQGSTAGGAPPVLQAGQTAHINIANPDLEPSFPYKYEDFDSFCKGWSYNYGIRFHFYEQGYDKGYCEVTFQQACGWDKGSGDIDVSWFTAFTSNSPQANCSYSNFGNVKYEKTGDFKADSGSYYKTFNFTFFNK